MYLKRFTILKVNIFVSRKYCENSESFGISRNETFKILKDKQRTPIDRWKLSLWWKKMFIVVFLWVKYRFFVPKKSLWNFFKNFWCSLASHLQCLLFSERDRIIDSYYLYSFIIKSTHVRPTFTGRSTRF